MNRFPVNDMSVKKLRVSRSAGFTLVEFLVAMAVFTIVGGSVLAMFANQAPYFSRQQNLAGLNIAMQNAVSELQLNLANAGTGYYPGIVIPSWPIGVTITNQNYGSTACNNPSTFTYTSTCFDKLNILTVNPSVLPSHPTNSTGSSASTACSYITGPSPFYILPNSGQTLAQTAAGFSIGDQVLLVKSGGGGGGTQGPNGSTSTTGTNGAQVNTFVITAAPVVNASTVALTFVPSTDTTSYTNLPVNDPLDISTPSTSSTTDSLNLGNSFCASDWLMKLDPTTYRVDLTNSQDPKLVRDQGGNTDTIAEQIIGFKVGGSTWNINNAQDLTYSFYSQNSPSATPSGYNKNYALVRSVRVTLIGRTNPNPDPTYTFRNTFDGGPYQVQGATVVINPRNITMNNE